MNRHDAHEAPLMFRGVGPRRSFVRTAQLNMVGRAALVGSCIAASSLGFAAGRFLGLPVAFTTSAAGLLPLAVVVAVDRRRWRSMLVGYGWGGTVAEVSAVAADLGLRGVAADVEGDDDGENASLRYRNADADVVRTVLADHGVSGTWTT